MDRREGWIGREGERESGREREKTGHSWNVKMDKNIVKHATNSLNVKLPITQRKLCPPLRTLTSTIVRTRLRQHIMSTTSSMPLKEGTKNTENSKFYRTV